MKLRLHRWRGIALQVVAPGLIYLALACLFYWPISPLDSSHVVGGCACGDSVQQAWFLQWVAFALEHGHNPLFTTYLNAPAGTNLAVNTSMPLLGFLGWPVTALNNSFAAFNLLFRLGLAVSALSMYLVLRRYVRLRVAAFVGGLLFGFSPYMLAEGQSHVFLVFLPLLPPLIPVLDHWLIRADRDPYRFGALFGLLLGLETLISAELGAFFAILVVVALIPLAIRHHDLVRSRLPQLLRGLGAAVVVGVLVGGYVAWMFIAGPQRPQGPPHSVANIDSYHADLLSLIVPSRPQLLRPPLLHRTADGFVKGSVHENGFYLGIPLLAALTLGSVWLRRHTLVLSFATLGVTSFLLGLGTSLTVAGHVTAIPLPVAAITGVPILQEIGPTRFALAIQLAASVLLALVLDRALQRRPLTRARRAGAVSVVSLLVLVPLLPSSLAPNARVPSSAHFTNMALDQIPDGATVLPYPYPYYSTNVAMVWQMDSGMRFRMPGGEIYAPGPSHLSTNYPRGGLPSALWAVLVEQGQNWQAPSAAERAGLVSALRTYVATHRIDAVVISTSGAQGRWVTAAAVSAFGAATSVRGALSVWTKLAGS